MSFLRTTRQVFCYFMNVKILFLRHGVGRARHSGWSENSFIMVAYENTFFKVQSEFSVQIHNLKTCQNGVAYTVFIKILNVCHCGFSWREWKFSEFSAVRESDKSPKHELGWIYGSCLSHVSCWRYDSILVSYTMGGRFEPFCCNDK